MKNQFRRLQGNRAGAGPRHGHAPVILIALVVLVSTVSANATAFTVRIATNGELAFNPSSLTVQVGDTVQWVWDASGHSTTSGTPTGGPDGMWDSGILNLGSTFSHTFLAAGSFPYYCMPHGLCCGMTGMVTVTAPSPTPTATPTATPTPSVSPSPTPSATPVNATLADISTRGQILTGDSVLIGGFIVTGTESKKLLVRAIGPSLGPLGVAGAISDPTLELHQTVMGNDVTLAANDNWMEAANMQDILESGLAPTNNLESVILMDSLDPGSYTAIVRGANNTTGVGLVEVYDLNAAGASVLANISTRGLVGTGDNVLIGGTIVIGGSDQSVLIRAIGPSLTGVGVTGALADPVLELHDSNGTLIASNDDWVDAENKQAIIDTTIPPTDDAESAILVTLTPDAYTAIVSGKNGTSGVALVEAYQLDN